MSSTDALHQEVQDSQSNALIKAKTLDILEQAEAIKLRLGTEAAKKEYDELRISTIGALKELRIQTVSDLDDIKKNVTENISHTTISNKNPVTAEKEVEKFIDGSVKDIPFENMSQEQSLNSLNNINIKYQSLGEAGYIEKFTAATSGGIPLNISEVTSKRSGNLAQEILIKRIIGNDTGFGNGFIQGFDKTKGNYVVSINETESLLKDPTRTITSGSEENKINSLLVANYLKYLSSLGGNLKVNFVNAFGENKARELMTRWIGEGYSIAEKELEQSGFGKIIEEIKGSENLLDGNEDDVIANLALSPLEKVKGIIKNISSLPDINERARKIDLLNIVVNKGGLLSSTQEIKETVKNALDYFKGNGKEIFKKGIEGLLLQANPKVTDEVKNKILEDTEILKILDDALEQLVKDANINNTSEIPALLVSRINTLLSKNGVNIEIDKKEVVNFSKFVTSLNERKWATALKETTANAQEAVKQETMLGANGYNARNTALTKEAMENAQNNATLAKAQSDIISNFSGKKISDLSKGKTKKERTRIFKEAIKASPKLQQIVTDYDNQMNTLYTSRNTGEKINTLKDMGITQKTNDAENQNLIPSSTLITSTKNGPVIETTGGFQIPITPEEQKIAEKNPETLQNMINFYEFFKDLNLESVWKYRTELVHTMGDISINLRDDSINPTELVKFGNAFIKIVNGFLPAGEELHEKQASIFSLKAELRRFSQSGNFMSQNKEFNRLGEDRFGSLMRKYGIIGGVMFETENLRKAMREEGQFSDEHIG